MKFIRVLNSHSVDKNSSSKHSDKIILQNVFFFSTEDFSFNAAFVLAPSCNVYVMHYKKVLLTVVKWKSDYFTFLDLWISFRKINRTLFKSWCLFEQSYFFFFFKYPDKPNKSVFCKLSSYSGLEKHDNAAKGKLWEMIDDYLTTQLGLCSFIAWQPHMLYTVNWID